MVVKAVVILVVFNYIFISADSLDLFSQKNEELDMLVRS